MPASSSTACPPLAVLNPGGRDPFLDYGKRPAPSESGVHPPVNFHAFAACSRGAFCQNTRDILERSPGRFQHALVLLRRRMAPCLRAVRELRSAGLRVLVSWKECGFTQVSQQLNQPDLWSMYTEILSLAQGIISPTGMPFPAPPSQPPLPFHALPTPYPVDFPEWDFSIPLPERSGIFVGTREFSTPPRNHLAALSVALRVAERTSTHVTVINSEKRQGSRMLQSLTVGLPKERLRILDGRLPYDAYLRTIASHRVIFQLDRSSVPGQVAGDALLCRSLCLGGNSAIEQIAFPDHCPPNLPETGMADHLARLLTDDRFLEDSIAQSQNRAREQLSFAACAQKLAQILQD